MSSESTLSQDWRADHDYFKVSDYLHDFVGVSQRQNLLDDLSEFLYMSKLDWAYKNRKRFSPEVCLVTVAEPDTREILDIGGTIPSDLFVDNFGFILAATYGVVNQQVVGVKDTGNTARTICVSGNGTANLWQPNNPFTEIQIGSGTTAPARSDIAIQTAFSVAPENALFASGSASYGAGSGTVTLSGSITTGVESGTINEAVIGWTKLTSTAPAQFTAIAAHDATTATAFTSGKSVTVQYSLSD